MWKEKCSFLDVFRGGHAQRDSAAQFVQNLWHLEFLFFY